MFIEHLDGPLSQAGTVETFIQVEESCRGEDVSEYPAIGEIRGAGCTLVIQTGMGPPQYVLTVHCPGSPNPQEAPTIHHMQQPAVWRVQVIGAHVVLLCWPIDAGIVLHIELLKGRAYLSA